ncbi:MAG: FHA domain-containing protein [Planctomycetes bacterium]|nr:FHA domain-containing protein [Planctomycetota bacterium]
MVRLVVTAGAESRVVESSDRVVTIGRGHENALQIHDEAGSRKHCAIEQLADGSFKVSDLASRNGTRLNGEAVREKAIKVGDVILIGTTKIVVEALTTEAAPAGGAPQAMPAAQPEGAKPSLRLVFTAGPNKGQIHLVTERVTSIGRRRRDNDIALFDTGISNRHAEIRLGPEGFVLADVGSKNGTFLNGHRVQHSPIKPGDQVQIGHSTIEVQAADATTAPTTHIVSPPWEELAPHATREPAPEPKSTAEVSPLAPPAPVPSRGRVLLLIGAITIAACIFAGIHIMRAIRSTKPKPPPEENKQPDGEKSPDKGKAQLPPQPTTGTRVATSTAAAPRKGGTPKEDERKAELDAALDLVRRADLTGEAADFDAAQKALEALRAALKGTALEADAAKALAGLPAARQAAAERRRDAAAAALLAAAKRCRDSREPHLAALHCRELLGRFPDSPAAAEAKALLNTLDAPAALPKEK